MFKRYLLTKLFLFVVVVLSVCDPNVDSEKTSILSCVPIQDCPYIYNLTKHQHNNAEEVFQMLKKAHCGFDPPDNPKVWCEGIVQQKCLTPDGHDGICTAESVCHEKYTPELIALSYSKENECGEDNTHVCCPVRKGDIKMAPLPLPGECGFHPLSRKIFGGKETELDEFAWMGILQYRRGNSLKQACTASLINREFLVTAAHCVDPGAVTAMGYTKLESVVLGEYNTATDIDCIEYEEGDQDCADEPKIIPIQSTVLHPQWKYPDRDNDIALLKLVAPVNYTNFIKPICLPLEGWTPAAAERLLISGWGKSPKETRTTIKMKAVVSHTPCQSNTSPTQICAGGNGTDICSGDSGGPLMLGRFVGKHYLIFLGGIASYGTSRCGTSSSVYTFVPSYINWIQSEIEK